LSGLNVDSGGLDEQSRLTTAITGDRQRGFVRPMLAVFFRLVRMTMVWFEIDSDDEAWLLSFCVEIEF
jgi:hypothetical protein